MYVSAREGGIGILTNLPEIHHLPLPARANARRLHQHSSTDMASYRFTARTRTRRALTPSASCSSWKQSSQITCNCRHPTPNKSCLVCAGLPRRLPRLGSAGTPSRPSASSTPPRRRPMGLLVAAEVGHHWDQKLFPSRRRIRSPSS